MERTGSVQCVQSAEPVSFHPYFLQTCDVSTYSRPKYGGIKYRKKSDLLQHLVSDHKLQHRVTSIDENK